MNGDYKLIADYVACELLLKIRGDTFLPQTWIAAGEELRCLVLAHSCSVAPPGQYFAAQEGGLGVVTYNSALPPQYCCLVLVHELAHHILMRTSTASLFDYVRCFNYNGESDARHDIARAVESIIFPGIRRSSKIRYFQSCAYWRSA